MIRGSVTPAREIVPDGVGGSVVLTSRTWSVSAGGGHGGVHASYSAPQWVEHPTSGARIRIVDHVMVARLAGLAAIGVALVVSAVRKVVSS